jgi:hypothetical protein
VCDGDAGEFGLAELSLDFSNTLSKSQIEEMASVDELEVVKEVQVSIIDLCTLTICKAKSLGILRRLPCSIPFAFLLDSSGPSRRRRRPIQRRFISRLHVHGASNLCMTMTVSS